MKKLICIICFFAVMTAIIAENNHKVAICVINDKITPFKQSIIDSLYSAHPGINFVRIPSKEIFKIKQNDYHKIIIMDQLEAWTIFNRKLKKVVKTFNPQKCIYVVTAGDPEWKWKKEGLTTITSASKKSNLPKIISQINAELEGKK